MENTAMGHAASGGSPNLLMPETLMVILTWGTFFILLFVLQKFAWKPILVSLKKREDHIRKSLEDADKIKEQLAQIEIAKIKILDEAKAQANGIIEQSRKTGHELELQIEQKAKKSAEEIISSAYQEIQGERERVRQALKKESVQTAVTLAERILKENLDTEKNRNLINQAIKDF
ncbi:MAG: F0F1 ATP synthase subunit B [Candidatus Omnitrophica bacterium]|nr:F0F1 ATP synthase subunit B [Candidatus Omnitrophota bacterium]